MIKKIIKYIILTIIGIVLFYFTHQAASVNREVPGVGGEVCFLLLPVLWYLAGNTIEDWISQIIDRFKW
jgi:hypothetical protein